MIYDRLDLSRFRWSSLSTVLVVVDFLVVAIGAVVGSPWAVWAGLLSGLSACCLAARDKGHRGNLIHAVLPLFVLVRPPFAADLHLIGALQSWTTVVASKILHQVGILHFRSGNVIELADKSLLVEEACSGIQSLFAVVFAGVVVIALRRRRLLHGLMLLPFTFLWAAVFNVLRVLAIAIAWENYQMDLSAGTTHTVLGLSLIHI